jgi:transposase
MSWAQEWTKEGLELDWQKLLSLRGFQVLPRRWVVERSFAWIGHTRRMSKDYERLCSTSEAFVYAAIIRLCRHCSMEAIPSQQTTASASFLKRGINKVKGYR